MTTKYLTGAFASGYTLKAGYTGLYVETTGTVNGTGLVVNTNLGVGNHGVLAAGTVSGDDGVKLTAGGLAANYNIISGYIGVLGNSASATNVFNKGNIYGSEDGVLLVAASYVKNYATIGGGLYGVAVLSGSVSIFNDGSISSSGDGVDIVSGTVDNAGYLAALSYGVVASGAATVLNGYTILSLGTGVDLEAGGTLTNDGYIASLLGGMGVEVATGSVINAGTVMSASLGGVSPAVSLTNGANLTNGSATDTTALIEGMAALSATTTTANHSVVTNFGSMIGTAATPGTTTPAVYMQGGQLQNGSNVDTVALIKGFSGVTMTAGGTVDNFGLIESTGVAPAYSSGAGVGVDFTAGGKLVNGSKTDHGAFIDGRVAVYIAGAAGTVTNYGVIETTSSDYGDGVDLIKGGKVTNGSAGDTTALIEGYDAVNWAGAAGTLVNFGTVLSPSSFAVLGGSGQVVNGTATDTHALIQGYVGVDLGGASVVHNFGTIISTQTPSAGVYAASVYNGGAADTTALISGGQGVRAFGAGRVFNYATILGGYGHGVTAAGGTVSNGLGPDTTALIKGYGGIYESGAATIANTGTIDGTSKFGVSLKAGGAITNGYGGQVSALIEGITAVALSGGGLAHNYGTLNGGSGFGAFASAGGTIVNGGGVNHTALIQGLIGAEMFGGASTLKNFGTVRATGGSGRYGVRLTSATLINGSGANATALIEGYGGAYLYGGTATNLGVIRGAGDAGGAGVYFTGGAAVLVNGNAAHPGAIVIGYTGVSAIGAATLTNFGTVSGLGGTAVNFTVATDRLVIEPNCVFAGAVYGGGGILEVGGGSGTLTGLLTGGSVAVSGLMAATTFHGFGGVQIDGPASLTLAGGAALAGGQSLTVHGTATTSGILTSAGVLTFGGTLAGTGTLALTGGTANLNAGATLTIAKVTENGAALVNCNVASLTVTDVWVQNAGTIDAGAGDRLNFSGTGDSFSGTLGGAGTIAFTGGTDLISAAHISAAGVVINGAAVTLSGSLFNSSVVSVTATNLTVATAGASLSGGGTVALSNLATNMIVGATSTATLTNVNNKITGAGTITSLVLVNQAGGTINGNLTTALVINTGSNTIINAGLIENVGAGGTTIASAVNNTGTMTVTAGTLLAQGAVSGAGIVKIGGGTADFASSFTENVTFSSTTGVLELAKSQTYTGQVTGFSKTGTTSLDLLDIAFGGSTTAKFSGTTASGVLTVTDGTHTAKITLIGNYTASTFTPTSDGHGGTTVVDPTAAPTGRTPPMLPLVTAMAGFGAKAAGSFALRESGAERPLTSLARPV